MEIKKSIQLTKEPLEYLLKHGETIDFRLDEEAWAELKGGDIIEFWEDFSGWDKQPSAHSRRITVKIEDIIRAHSFAELVDTFPESFTEKGNKDEILSDLRQWWTPEREKQTGVLGFKVKAVSPTTSS